eukprot:2236953-Rhodomonas_salina.2
MGLELEEVASRFESDQDKVEMSSVRLLRADNQPVVPEPPGQVATGSDDGGVLMERPCADQGGYGFRFRDKGKRNKSLPWLVSQHGIVLMTNHHRHGDLGHD